MVLSGTLAARPSACLRCQLRQALVQTRTRSGAPQRLDRRCRAFTTTRILSDEEEDLFVKTKEGYRFKSAHDKGKIVGKPGKRQRVTSKRLTRDSLNKPANVIIFQDVKETPKAAPSTSRSANVALNEEVTFGAQDIENAITGRYVAPAEEEVNASIDALRPNETILDEEHFEKLRQRLIKGYNYRQLCRYAVTSNTKLALEPTRKGANRNKPAVSQWRPGESVLSQRHSQSSKKSSTSSKDRVVEQILRVGWGITIQAEVQAVGEIEMRLQPWQLSMLFDLSVDNRPYFEICIGSKALIDACNIYDVRSAEVVRVTGRQHDAEEVARRFTTLLMNTKRYEVDLAAYAPLLPNHGDIVKTGPVFSENLRFISDITKCAALPEDKKIAIYGVSEPNMRSAHRMVLSLLDLQSPASFDGTFNALDTSTRKDQERPRASNVTLTKSSALGLHRRYRSLDLVRAVSCLRGENVPATTVTASSSDLTSKLKNRLESVKEPSHGLVEQYPGSYWRGETRLSDWQAEYCNILHETSDLPKACSKHRLAAKSSSTILQYDGSGTETLLSYLEPREFPRQLNPAATKSPLGAPRDNGRHVFDRRMPFLNVYFVPALHLAESSRRAPRIQMKFRFSAPSGINRHRKVQLVGCKAYIDHQHLSVSLPAHATDIRFSREVTMLSATHRALSNPHIAKFVGRLEESVQAGQGALDAPSDMRFNLPAWLLEGNDMNQANGEKETEVPYVLERFEQVQNVVFRPSEDVDYGEMDDEIKSTFNCAPGNSYMYLDYKETEGGAIHGSLAFLTLRMRRLSAAQAEDVVQNNAEISSSSGLEKDSAAGNESPVVKAVSEKVQEMDLASDSSSPTAQQTVDFRGTGSHSEGGRGDNEEAGVELAAKSSQSSPDSSVNTSEKLVSAALGIASLLTRASNESLGRFGANRQESAGPIHRIKMH